MKYIVAVSGGVDSVVLLDMLTRAPDPEELVVAHFDHGIRPESADDEEFVHELARKYGLLYESMREELGPTASEELARDRRYNFLRDVAKKHSAKIVTAHHADDVVETIAINLTRGTGWRGLAVLDSPDIRRPLLHMTKADIVEYAQANALEWREDPTNNDTKYLRNDLRQKLKTLDSQSKELLGLYRDRQVALRKMIDTEIDTYVHPPYSRYFFIMINDSVAIDILRGIILRETGQSLLRPQLERALLAVKTYQTGKIFAIDAASVLHFSRTDFVVEKRETGPKV